MIKIQESTEYIDYGKHTYTVKLSGNKYYVYVKTKENPSPYYYAVGNMFGKNSNPIGDIVFNIYNPDSNIKVYGDIYANPTENDYRDLLDELEIYNSKISVSNNK